ncbi:MAG: hypothetical protein V3T35_08595 [Spirochaetia bacterium]
MDLAGTSEVTSTGYYKVYNVMIVQEVAAFLLAAGSDLRCVQTLTGSGSAAEETGPAVI